jgi:hypothetical protein
MSSEIFWLYLLTRLDGVLTVAVCVLIVYGLAVVGGAIQTIEAYNLEYEDSFMKKVMDKLYVLITAIAVVVFVPNQKDVAFILAGTGVIEAAKTDTAQRLAGKSVTVVEQYLDELLKKEEKK